MLLLCCFSHEAGRPYRRSRLRFLRCLRLRAIPRSLERLGARAIKRHYSITDKTLDAPIWRCFRNFPARKASRWNARGPWVRGQRGHGVHTAKLNFVLSCPACTVGSQKTGRAAGGGSPAHPAITLRLHRGLAIAAAEHHLPATVSSCRPAYYYRYPMRMYSTLASVSGAAVPPFSSQVHLQQSHHGIVAFRAVV